jgi:hypothetical protein
MNDGAKVLLRMDDRPLRFLRRERCEPESPSMLEDVIDRGFIVIFHLLPNHDLQFAQKNGSDHAECLWAIMY